MHSDAQQPFGDESSLLDFWRSVVDPHSIGMAESLASEIAAYRAEPVAEVLLHMEAGKDDFKQLWNASNLDASNAKSVEAFYRDQFIEAYELANWHAGRTNGTPPLHYARASALARQKNLTRVLDFGSGIGTGSLCLAAIGCEVHTADIARQLLQFVKFRLERRGFHPRLIDLSGGQAPPEGYFDLITCFDVLEHVPDQEAKLRELSSYLRPGGYLMVNLMNDSFHPDRPMHISSAGDWLALVRKGCVTPDWSLYTGEIQVLVKSRFARVKNAIGSLVDRCQDAFKRQVSGHRIGP